ncbi:MAG: carbamate kinase [Endozoicomonas sp.]
MLVVIALGDSAIVQRHQPLATHLLRQSVRDAAKAIAAIALKHQVVLLHGNGPQIGLLTLMNGNSTDLNAAAADVLGAQTRGIIGFLLEQELRNRMPGRQICSLIHLALVDADAPELMNPNRFIGPVYNRAQAQLVQEQNPDWVLQGDGRYYRRTIAAPPPREILELPAIRQLVKTGNITVICGSGGGLPVRKDGDGKLHGVEAMVDRDLSAALIANGLSADALLLLTSTEAVIDRPGEPGAKTIRTMTPEGFRSLGFSDTAMGPKMNAACRFVYNDSRFCAIGNLNNAAEVLSGTSGTRIHFSGNASGEAQIDYY